MRSLSCYWPLNEGYLMLMYLFDSTRFSVEDITCIFMNCQFLEVYIYHILSNTHWLASSVLVKTIFYVRRNLTYKKQFKSMKFNWNNDNFFCRPLLANYFGYLCKWLPNRMAVTRTMLTLRYCLQFGFTFTNFLFVLA